MKELKPIKEGKVREIYDNGDSLIMVATDRISCFDVILNNEVTKKGTVLTQMSKFWFDLTEDILPNHMISVDVKDMPEFFRQDKFDGNSMLCRKLEMLPIECIVRGYITGSGWASYQENGTVCGIKLPEGLKESEDVKTNINKRCREQFSCGLITLNDWRAQIGESMIENPLFDKLKFDMSDEELDKVNRVFNTKSGDEKDGRENQKPSVQDKGK